MTTNISEISVTELDFDTIKQNLIDYFSADPTFQDYDFEAAGLNIIMDILAYNTHMNAVTANLSANEMFIDSAQLRQSIVSLAKSIGYTPRSVRTSVANVRLDFTDISGFPAYITMEAGTRFITPDGFIYSTKEQKLIYPTSGVSTQGATGDYSIDNVDIFEGHYNSFRYVVDTAADQNFVVPSTDADMSTLRVINISGGVTTEFTLNDNITLADADSTIYFLHENPDGTFEVTFGDGILGRPVLNGSEIYLSYVISKYKAEANNSSVFEKNQPIGGYNTYTITTNTVAYGGDEAQSKESIAALAPKMYKAQSRAVVTEDYENFMFTAYPWIESMSIWGGEYSDPPVYGKVFIAIKPTHTDIISESLKETIKEDLISNYNVVTIIPEIVDPDYIYMLVESNVEYDASATTKSADEISVLVKESIESYFTTNTELFNRPFYYSKMSTAIDSSDTSIANSLSTLKMMKRFTPIIGINESRTIDFSNSIEPKTIYSSFYNISGTTGTTSKQTILDDGLGNLYTRNVLTNEIVFSSVGTVDYDSGVLEINIIVYELPSDTGDLRMYCTPAEANIDSAFDQIIVLDDSPGNLDFGRTQGVLVGVTVETKGNK